MAGRSAATGGGGGWDWPATFAARGAEPLASQHLRRQTPPPTGQRLHCFVLDCSGSMAAGGALARAKGVLLALMEQAYRRRERVALLCFAGTRVELRLPPRKASAWNDDWVAPIGAGGGTPLGPAIAQAAQLLAREVRPGGEGWLWLLTDGRARDQPERPGAATQVHVIDFEQGRVRLGRAQALARDWGVECLRAQAWGAMTAQ